MNVVLSASKLMTAAQANKQIKEALKNKEGLALADLQAKQSLEHLKNKKTQKKIASQVS